MPIIQVHMIEGRSLEQKRKLVSDMTKVVVDDLGVKAEDVKIILQEMAKQHYSVGGTLFSDK